ncbi:MAG: hypothetical protein ACE5GA_03865, partial [Candidatus Zixiibacteriota bacterium]
MTQIDQETTLKAITRFAATARDVRGSVGEREERETAERFVVEINRAINPPRALSADQVIVRSLLLASDATNHYGGRFAGDELRRIAELAVDSPVLVGHRKDTLPIARVFRASVINHEGQRWAKAFFYWLRESSGSETLAANIDGGVYKECSLGFTFLRAECSICGADIRSCPHTPDAAIPDSVRSKQSDGQDCVYYY